MAIFSIFRKKPYAVWNFFRFSVKSRMPYDVQVRRVKPYMAGISRWPTVVLRTRGSRLIALGRVSLPS